MEELFKFKVCEGEDKPAIYFKLHGREVIVFPFALYQIFWYATEYVIICKDVKARFYFFTNSVYVSYFDYTCGCYNEEYPKDLFVKSAISSLKQLCDAVLGEKSVAYSRFKKNAANQMLAGLKDIIIPQNYHPVSEKEFNNERFSFDFVEPYSCDTDYIIRIGERKYSSALSDWTTDFDRIRIDIEKYIHSYMTYKDVELYFEDSPTIIRLYKTSGKDHKENACVTIFSNDFIDEPIVFGTCDSRQLVSALYIGLLGLCIWETDWFDNEREGDWNEFRLATYNKLQSCIIENYIKGISEDDYSYYPRQRIVNSVNAMKEDYHMIKEKYRYIF